MSQTITTSAALVSLARRVETASRYLDDNRPTQARAELKLAQEALDVYCDPAPELPNPFYGASISGA